MSKFLNLEEKANSLLKRLTNLLENLSSNLSKEKTENALCEGNNYIKELDDIMINMEKLKENKIDNIYMIKGDFLRKKEKFENFQKAYILNKSNQFMDSLPTNINIDESNNDSNNINDIYDINDNEIFEDVNDNTYGKNFIEEYFKENKNLTELKEGYIYNDSCIFKIKKLFNIFFSKISNIIKEISPKTKYLIILILLIVSLILCIMGLYFSIINEVKK